MWAENEKSIKTIMQKTLKLYQFWSFLDHFGNTQKSPEMSTTTTCSMKPNLHLLNSMCHTLQLGNKFGTWRVWENKA